MVTNASVNSENMPVLGSHRELKADARRLTQSARSSGSGADLRQKSASPTAMSIRPFSGRTERATRMR